MKKSNIFLLALLITIFFSCKKKNFERNRLVFKDNVNSVQDSLIIFRSLLTKLSKRNDDKNVNYIIESGKLKVNDTLMVDYLLKHKRDSATLSLKEINAFIRISNFFKENYIISAYYDEAGKIWRFIYRDFAERTYNDTRDICILDSLELKSILSTDKILDSKNRIYLLAPKDVAID